MQHTPSRKNDRTAPKKKKTYKCLCGKTPSFSDCAYLNPEKRPSNWRGNPEVQQKFLDAMEDPKNKKGGAIKGALKRLDKPWEDVRIGSQPDEVKYNP